MALRNAPAAIRARIGSVAERLSSKVPAVEGDSTSLDPLIARVRAALPVGTEVHGFTVTAKPLSWFDTGLQLRERESITVISTGVVHLAKALKLSLLPKSVAWWRVGDADIQKAPGETWTFQTQTSGPLKFAAGTAPLPEPGETAAGLALSVASRTGRVVPRRARRAAVRDRF